MSNYEMFIFLSFIAIIFLLAKQLHTSQKMKVDISELRNAFGNSLDRQTIYLRYLVTYARLESKLSEREQSAFNLNMDIELQCVGLDAEQADRLSEEERKAWQEHNELLEKGFFTTK